MWAVRVLKGPQPGQVITLHPGESLIGRATHCALQFGVHGVSKEHAKLIVQKDKIQIEDLNSTNGTFVNGVKIKSKTLQKGDRISVHDIILQVVDERTAMSLVPSGASSQNLPVAGSSALQPAVQSDVAAIASSDSGIPDLPPPKNAVEAARHYFETVALPGVYKLAEVFEFKFVLGGFVLGFILLVTLLSVIPMVRISKHSIEKESQRRAVTIAQGLHDRYMIALAAGNANGFDTRFAEREDGVRVALIVSASDGAILAPVTRSGAYSQDEFVHSARKKEDTVIQQIDDSTVGVSVPIKLTDQETGLLVPKAYAVVLYNMGSLAVDNEQVNSLFMQVLFIATVLGIILFVFMYRLIEAPVARLNRDLDFAMKKGQEKVDTPFHFPVAQELSLKISSLLGRATGSTSSTGPSPAKDIYSEATQLIRIINDPGFVFDSHQAIIAINSAFADLLGISLNHLDNANLTQIPSDSIVELLPELIERASAPGATFISTPIHMNERDLEMNLLTIRGARGIDYFVVTIHPPTMEGGVI